MFKSTRHKDQLYINLNKDRSGRKRIGRTRENINFLQEKIIENPRISARMYG